MRIVNAEGRFFAATRRNRDGSHTLVWAEDPSEAREIDPETDLSRLTAMVPEGAELSDRTMQTAMLTRREDLRLDREVRAALDRDDVAAAEAALALMSDEERAKWSAPDPVQDAAAEIEREARGLPESMRGGR